MAPRARLWLTALLMGLAAPAPAETIPDAAAQPILTDLDRAMRMTVPVRVNGEGPYAFIVDTGADRTVVSRTLATTLHLPSAGPATIHSVTGVDRVETVRIGSLEVGTHRGGAIAAAALDERHLGAAGMLGIDMLARQRVTLDFAGRTMRIEPGASRFAPRADDEASVIIVRARRKYGQLILAKAEVSGIPVKVIIDTGAQVSIGNPALRRRLRHSQPQPTLISSVTGGTAAAEYLVVPELKIGDAAVRSLPIAFADVHAFRRFGLDRSPAMLLGMDALSAMQRVSIDFSTRSVRFALPPPAMASADR